MAATPPLLTSDAALKKHFENQFLLASLLSSGDTITLGFSNFSSDSLSGSSYSSDIEALNLRNSLTVLSIPYTFTFDYDDEDYYDNLRFSVSMIETARSYDND
ncbi:MAG TPA: hypothetical protein EYH12_06435 [Psychromonas hadalis]|nr:hypothetical protein [Psychromonas hadalis]